MQHRTTLPIFPCKSKGAVCFACYIIINNILQIVENSFRKAISDPLIGTFVDPNDVIALDGFQRDFISVNDAFRGPTIEVMEGAQVSGALLLLFLLLPLLLPWELYIGQKIRGLLKVLISYDMVF